MDTGETFRLIGLAGVDPAILQWLAAELPKAFKGVQIHSKRVLLDLPPPGGTNLKQYSAEAVLDSLSPSALRTLALVDQDLYVPGLNFIFGLAQPERRRAIVALPRLREEFYGRLKNEELFHARMVKEALHELGHTFGLEHCSNSHCVMYFSNTLADTDRKSAHFCANCAARI